MPEYSFDLESSDNTTMLASLFRNGQYEDVACFLLNKFKFQETRIIDLEKAMAGKEGFDV